MAKPTAEPVQEQDVLQAIPEDLGDQLEREVESSSQVKAEEDFGLWSFGTAGTKRLKVLLYGHSGAGKTRMSATFPKPLFLDLEGGLRSTLQVGPVLRYPSDPRKEITTLEEVKAFYRLVRKTTNPPFETIVIDSLNELQILVQKHVVSNYDANRQYDDQPTMADYGKIIRDFTSIVRLFLKLPYHIVLTAISIPREYPEQEVYPSFIGKKTGPEIHRMMEMIGYCHTKRNSDDQSEYWVSFQQSPLYVAKDRMGIVSRNIHNSYQALMASASTSPQEGTE